LTGKAISHKLAAMNGDLDSLEQKIEQVMAVCGQLRSENHALRAQVVELEQKKQLLVSRAESARERLETLMDKLPAE
jgi:uncharacterized protein (TIGR02449 family)